MMYVTKWELDGQMYSLEELTNISKCQVPKRVLADRLKNGWDVKIALSTPAEPLMISRDAANLYASGSIAICFTADIPGVFQELQPELNKIYIAEPHCAGHTKQKAKLYYTITLENGKPLIVYPGEFVQVGNAVAA